MPTQSITPADLIPLVDEMCSISRRHLDIWRICVQAGSVLFRSRDVARIAAVAQCHPRTVQRAIRAIRLRPHLAAAVAWIGYPQASYLPIDLSKCQPPDRDQELEENLEEDLPLEEDLNSGRPPRVEAAEDMEEGL